MTMISPVTKRLAWIRLIMVSATSSAVTTRLRGVAFARLPIRSSYWSLSMRFIQSPSMQPGAPRGLIADVAAHQQPLGAELLGLRAGFARRRLARAVVDGDVVAGAREREHGAAADAGRAAGNERGFSGRHSGADLRCDGSL